MCKRAGALTLSSLSSVLLAAGIAAAADPVGEPGRGAGEKNPLKNAYFGEQHMHTRNSFDAFTVGSTTWEQAYRCGMGEEMTHPTTGEKIKRKTPYDFVAITDHLEYFGVLKDLVDPESPLSRSDFARGFADGMKNPREPAQNT